MTAVAHYTPSTQNTQNTQNTQSTQNTQNAPESAAHTRRMGFSMIEVMGAVLLTSIVISIAVAFQINLGSATQNARERLRSQRQAVALLDRMSRDIAGTYFIAPRITNGAPESTPWIFLTIQDFLDEGLTSDSSNAIKFVTRNYVPQDIDGHSSDLAVVAYYVEPQEGRPGYQLMRYRSTHMPITYDPSFPQADAPNTDVVGEDIASFKIRVINQTGGVDPKWSSIRKSGQLALPLGVKLEISMLTTDEIIAAELDEDFEIPIERDEEDGEDGEEDGDRKTFAKTVMLPLRPLDWSFLEEIDNVEEASNNDDEAPDQDDEDEEDDDDDDDDDDDEDDEDEDES
jgi:type II secretory pathway component PulJ